MAGAGAGRDALWWAWTAALGGLIRLRLLRLAEREELGVGELARILQLPQSTVSRHLKLLLEGGWVGKRSEGTTSLYSLTASTLPESAARLWELARAQLPEETRRDDDERLAGVLAERRTDSRTFFGRLGGEWDSLRRELFGASFTGDALAGLLDPAWCVADLGCGTGDASERLAPLVRRVVAVDREPAMLDAARRRLAGLANVEFRQGELHALPLRDGEVDAAVIFLVLHHVADVAAAVGEAARTLRPGGRVLVVDMVRHDREAYARTMGHQHLGFYEADARSWARAGGLQLLRWVRLRPDPAGKGPALFSALLSR